MWTVASSWRLVTDDNRHAKLFTYFILRKESKSKNIQNESIFMMISLCVCVCVSALVWRHAGQLATLGVNDDNTQLPIITNRAQVNSKHCLYSVIKWSSPRISKKKSDLAFWLCVCDDKTTRDNSNETWIITCKANQYACRNWKYQRADNVAKDSFGTTDVKIMAHRQFLHTDKSLPF